MECDSGVKTVGKQGNCTCKTREEFSVIEENSTEVANNKKCERYSDARESTRVGSSGQVEVFNTRWR